MMGPRTRSDDPKPNEASSRKESLPRRFISMQQLLAREATLQREIDVLARKLATSRTSKSTKSSSQPPLRPSPRVEEGNDDALDAMTARLEAMVNVLGVAERALDRRDERLAKAPVAPPRRVHFEQGAHPTRDPVAHSLPAATPMVEVMAMLETAPTEALVQIVDRLRAANDAASTSATAATSSVARNRPAAMGSLDLQGGEA